MCLTMRVLNIKSFCCNSQNQPTDLKPGTLSMTFDDFIVMHGRAYGKGSQARACPYREFSKPTPLDACWRLPLLTAFWLSEA